MIGSLGLLYICFQTGNFVGMWITIHLECFTTCPEKQTTITGLKNKMRDLSVIIPGRNEEFLQKTIENVLENIQSDTEIIAICDGYWPDPPVLDHPRVIVVHHTDPIGQRAATNEGARISQAKFVMKLDAHCAVDKGFDAKLIKDCRRRNWTCS